MADPREVLRELVESFISEESPWTGRRQLRERARENSWDITVEEFDAAYEAARQDVDIITWHGLTTLAEEPYLTAAIEAEVESDVTRSVLVARLNQAKAGKYQPPAPPGEPGLDADDG